MPTLITKLSAVIPKKCSSKPLLCLICGMLLKQQFSKCLLYKGCYLFSYKEMEQINKIVLFMKLIIFLIESPFQIYNCLQPLMLRLSLFSTIKFIDRLSQDFDRNTHGWFCSVMDSLNTC